MSQIPPLQSESCDFVRVNDGYFGRQQMKSFLHTLISIQVTTKSLLAVCNGRFLSLLTSSLFEATPLASSRTTILAVLPVQLANITSNPINDTTPA
jgi:hypothetical protein